MADAIALVFIAAIVLGGVFALIRVRLARRAQLAERKKAALQRAEAGLDEDREYIKRVNAATSLEELDRLERERKP